MANCHRSEFSFPLPNGSTFTVQYDCSISEADVQQSNEIVNQYLPKLFDLFWMPAVDETVAVYQGSSVCGGYSACAEPNAVHVNETFWNDSTTWVHEFTHVLQFSLGRDLKGEAGLFYVEPTAIQAAAILTNRYEGSSSGDNNALWIPDWGVSLAALDYVRFHLWNDTHAATPTWVNLYAVDHEVFKKLNQRLHQLFQDGWYISDVPSLRELISQVVSVSTIDGLPLRNWLGVEGLLGEDEVGTAPTISIGLPISTVTYNSAGGISITFESYSISGQARLDANRTTATVYDAYTRAWLADISRAVANPGNLTNFVELSTTLNMTQLPNVVRVEVHIVGDGVNETHPILIPIYSAFYDHALMLATSDGWLRTVNGNVTIQNRTYPMTNGFAYFEFPKGITTIYYPGGTVENCLPDTQNVLVGVRPKALQVMHDTTTIIVTNTSGVTSTISNSSFNQQNVVLALLVLLIAYLIFKNRKRLRKQEASSDRLIKPRASESTSNKH